MKGYPQTAFSKETQRFAVGGRGIGAHASILIFCMRTGALWRRLEGHQRSVSAVAFSPSGHMLLSYSAEAREARQWNLRASLLGSLGLSSSSLFAAMGLGKGGACVIVPLPRLQPYQGGKKGDGDTGEGQGRGARGLRPLSIQWKGEDSARLVREDGRTVIEVHAPGTG